MRSIAFIDKNGGVWPSALDIKRGIDFRRVLSEATALERNIGAVTINLYTSGKSEDITEWVHNKAMRLA